MNYRPLGNTGMEVSLIGLGTVKLGRNSAVKYPRAFSLPTDDEARELLRTARDLGINLLDTAPAYGTSEARLGNLLRGERDQWLLCSKVGEIFEGGKSRYDFSETHTRQSVEASLTRLRTDWLDVLLIHSDGRDEEILNTFGTLEVLKAIRTEGKVRAVGISVKSAAGLQAAIAGGADVVMATLNRAYLSEQQAIAEAGASGVGVLVKKAMGSGHQGPQDLAFVASQPGVSSMVIGTINPEHLRMNCLTIAAV